MSTGVWYYYVATYDGTQSSNSTKLKLFINGQPQTLVYDGTVPTSIFTGSGKVGISLSSSDVPAFDGTIDDVRIYNVSLSAQQIAQLYAMGK